MTELEKCKAGMPYSFSDPEMVARKCEAIRQCEIFNAIDGTKEIKLSGQYLEQTLTGVDDKTIMVFGLPFKHDDSVDDHEYNYDKQVGWYTNDNWARETYSTTHKAHSAQYPAGATVATDTQRSNKYVYHNKIYYVYDSPSLAPRFNIAIFDAFEKDDDDPYIDTVTDEVPWPCDVYDLSGRKVASNETPATLRIHYPNISKGVYIFGGRKMVVR